MWDMRSGTCHRTLAGHAEQITSLQFDDCNIVTGGLDGTVKIWDMRSGGCMTTIVADGPVHSMAFDERMLYIGTTESMIKVR